MPDERHLEVPINQWLAELAQSIDERLDAVTPKPSFVLVTYLPGEPTSEGHLTIGMTPDTEGDLVAALTTAAKCAARIVGG